MYGRNHMHRVAALLTAVAALAFFAGSVQAANSSPAGMTKAEYRALMLRSEALNRQFALGSGTHKPAAMNPDGYRALVLRSKALNAKYGLGGAHVVLGLPRVARAGDGGGDLGEHEDPAQRHLRHLVARHHAVGDPLAGEHAPPHARVDRILFACPRISPEYRFRAFIALVTPGLTAEAITISSNPCTPASK